MQELQLLQPVNRNKENLLHTKYIKGCVVRKYYAAFINERRILNESFIGLIRFIIFNDIVVLSGCYIVMTQ